MTPRPPEPLDPDTQFELGLLCARYALPASAQAQLGGLLEHLDSQPHAPTTVRRAREAVNVHVADSLSALEVPGVREARTIADLGAGVGFPGMALAAALPEASVSLVESVGRKCDHMEAALRHAGTGNARTVRERVEAWHDGVGTQELVTARALASLAVVAEYAAPLMTDGGLLVAWKGKLEPDEMAAARKAAEILGLELAETFAVQPYEGVEHRNLVTFRKTAETPARYPRRTGVAQKQPLA